MTQTTPTQVARTLFEALVRGDWETAADLADPESLTAWHDFQIAVLVDEAEALAEPAVKQGGGSLRQIPTDQAAIAERVARYSGTVFSELFGGASLGELASLPARQLLSRYLDLTASMRRAPGSQAPPRIIGELVDSDNAAYVLYSWEGFGSPSEPREVAVLRLRRAPNGWWYLIDRLSGPPLSQLGALSKRGG